MLPKQVVHSGLKGRRRAGESKGHDLELVVTIARPERCLGYILLLNAHLPVSALQVELGVDLSALQAVKQLLYARQCVAVLDCELVQSAVVHAEAKGAVLLAHKEDGGSKR